MPNIIQQPNTVTNVFDQAANKTLLNLLNSIDKLHAVNTNLSSGSDSSSDILKDISKKMSNAQTADSIAGKDANKRNRVAQNLMNENAVKSRKALDDFKNKAIEGLASIKDTFKNLFSNYARDALRSYADFAKTMRTMQVSQELSAKLSLESDKSMLQISKTYGVNISKKQSDSAYSQLIGLQKGFELLDQERKDYAAVLVAAGKSAEEALTAAKNTAHVTSETTKTYVQRLMSGEQATGRYINAIEKSIDQNFIGRAFKGSQEETTKWLNDVSKAVSENMVSLNEDVAAKLAIEFQNYKTGGIEHVSGDYQALMQSFGKTSGTFSEFMSSLKNTIETRTRDEFDSILRPLSAPGSNADQALLAELYKLRNEVEGSSNHRLLTQQVKDYNTRRGEQENLTPEGKLKNWFDKGVAGLNVFTDGMLSKVITSLDNVLGDDTMTIVDNGFKIVIGLLTSLNAKAMWDSAKDLFNNLRRGPKRSRRNRSPRRSSRSPSRGKTPRGNAPRSTKPPRVPAGAQQAGKKGVTNALKGAGKRFMGSAAGKAIPVAGEILAAVGIADIAGSFMYEVASQNKEMNRVLSRRSDMIGKFLPDFINDWAISKEALAYTSAIMNPLGTGIELFMAHQDIVKEEAEKAAQAKKELDEGYKDLLMEEQARIGASDDMWTQFVSSLEGTTNEERVESLMDMYSKYGMDNVRDAIVNSSNMEEYMQKLSDSALSQNVKKIADNFNVKLGSVYDRVNEIQEKVAPYANGTIATQPTFGLFGEDGREAILPLTKKDRLKEIVGALSEQDRENIMQAIRETSSAQMPAINVSSTTPGDDLDSINKTLSYARPEDRARLYNAMVAGMAQRHKWYQESIANAASTEGRDLIKGTYAERALAYGVMELGKPYLLRSIGKIGYVCNELTDAALRKSGFDMKDFALHKVSTTFANLVSGKMFNGKTQVPAFRLRPDVTPETAYPGMVFFQTNKGKNEPGHIGLVYYGHQRLHSSGGTRDFNTKDGFLSSWTIPSRGVTINAFDKSAKYDFAEFPGLFAKADGSWPDWYTDGTFANKDQMDYSNKPNFVTNAMYAEAIRKLEAWQGGKMSPAEFISLFGPIATEDMRRTGIPASITLAQAALESGWGKTAKAEFRNLFGIKGRGNAGSAYVGTHEVRPGNIVEYKKDYFAQYATYLDSINAHSSYLLNAKRKKGLNGLRYGEALLNVFNPDMFAYKIKEGGYATSPTYAEKLISIMRSNRLYDWDLGPNELALQGVGDTQMALINQAKSNTYSQLQQQSNLQASAKEAIANAIINKQTLSHRDIVDMAAKLTSTDVRTLIAAIHEVRDELRKGTRTYSAVSTPLSVYA